MIKCIIVDDEPLALQLLNSYAEKIDDLEVLGTFSNPLDALKFVQANHVNVLFLDIQMPELTGVQLIKIIDKENIQVVFTTAYPEFAAEGFELEATDYLVKPISLGRFIKAVNKVQKKLQSTATTTFAETPPTHTASYLFVKSEYRHQKVDFGNILFLKGLGDYVAIHLEDGSKLLTLEKMKGFQASLPSDQFIRVHKSYIIAIEKINFIEKNRITIADEIIPIGATFQKDFWKKIE